MTADISQGATICRYSNANQPIEGQVGEGCGGEPAIKLVGFHTSCCHRATVSSYELLFIIIIISVCGGSALYQLAVRVADRCGQSGRVITTSARRGKVGVGQ